MYDPESGSGGPFDIGIFEANKTFIRRPSSLYPQGDAVGKSTAQVGRRDSKDGELVANDAEFFDKWTQALQSLDELVDEISDRRLLRNLSGGKPHCAVALPIVVVPDHSLWAVDYDADGGRRGPPRQVDQVSIYIGRSYTGPLPNYQFSISHLDVKTETGLSEFCDEMLANEETMEKFLRRA